MIEALKRLRTRLVEFVDSALDEFARELEKEAQKFKPSMVPNYVPAKEIVKQGLYESCCGQLHVEVLMQDPSNGLIHVEIYEEDDPYKRFDFISTGMFIRLFRPTSSVDYVFSSTRPRDCP